MCYTLLDENLLGGVEACALRADDVLTLGEVLEAERVFACTEGASAECCNAFAVHVEDVDACKACLACGKGDVGTIHAEASLLCRCDGLDGVRSERRAVFVQELNACDVALALVCSGEEFCFLVESVDDDSVVGDHVVEEHCAFKAVCTSQDEGDGE